MGVGDSGDEKFVARGPHGSWSVSSTSSGAPPGLDVDARCPRCPDAGQVTVVRISLGAWRDDRRSIPRDAGVVLEPSARLRSCGKGTVRPDEILVPGGVPPWQRFGNSSNAPRNPDDLNDLDAAGRIYTFCRRLRALAGVSRVVVRVHSSALLAAAAWTGSADGARDRGARAVAGPVRRCLRCARTGAKVGLWRSSSACDG